MFEALRGLRDAVAPESGNLGVVANDAMNNNGNINTAVAGGGGGGGLAGNTNNNNNSKDVEELYRLYCNGDEDVVALVNDPKFSLSLDKNNRKQQPPLRQLSDFVKWHEHMEQVKDAELVERLAAAVLEKSNEIDYAVDHKLPGMHRTRTEQMDHLRKLIEENAAVAKDLGEAYKKAQVRRDQCRSFIIENTGLALGIDTK
jgi:hypothetical protein